MARLLISLAAIALAAVYAEEEPKGAWLLAHKAPLSVYGVENKDYIVEYGLYNVGDRPATKVSLDDRNSYPSQYFELITGELQFTVERIPAGGNVTHVVILRPLNAGLFNYTAGQLTYRPDDNSNDIRVGLTTNPGEGYIYKEKEYNRRFGSKLQYFGIFFLLISPITLGSLKVVLSYSEKYKNISDAKKGKKEEKEH